MSLLELFDAKFPTPEALTAGVAGALLAPAVFSRTRRALQVGASAFVPAAITAVSVGGLLTAGRKNPDIVASIGPLWPVALKIAAGSFVVVMVASCVGALVTGSGFTFRPAGAALVNRRGQRASRLRALWRWAVTWTPMVVILVAVEGTSAASASPWLAVLRSGLMLAFIAAAVWAILNPSRSIQDRIAGTWIVPR